MFLCAVKNGRETQAVKELKGAVFKCLDKHRDKQSVRLLK